MHVCLPLNCAYPGVCVRGSLYASTMHTKDENMLRTQMMKPPVLTHLVCSPLAMMHGVQWVDVWSDNVAFFVHSM